MKKVLIISSSPRCNGNSELLCDQFAAGAVDAGHEVEKISLAGKRLAPCIACYACRKGACVHKDEAPAILEKMLEADVIVLATPVYFYTMSAQLKILIDRSVMIFPRLTGKRFYYLMTMADSDRAMFGGTLAALRGFLACYEGSEESGMVCADGVYEKGEVKNTPFWRQSYELGRAV